ncbi:oxidative damage protection protein [Buchnera aphidicola (Muscaphis stroyani)]|uniref:Probable Fe(2+)-trafficking protein n=1 Tax=Buchnera aphidicola (Muscaphis stroyani) TaxID=1241869 RepID=A0A4D6Y4H4_9GAMM|nr:oxidative damage protection protein [Buchnera aphidicola]QCI24586.1 oxidative damage protection protein [Buchnera aphidicola (Muscaphis stroyani)]
MNRLIFCVFLKKESEKQDFQPYPGELGKKIYNKISKIAWNKWISRQTILINEKKLNMFNQSDRKILETQMKLFLFKEK